MKNCVRLVVVKNLIMISDTYFKTLLSYLVAKSNSIRGFVRRSVGPSVGHGFLENRKFK